MRKAILPIFIVFNTDFAHNRVSGNRRANVPIDSTTTSDKANATDPYPIGEWVQIPISGPVNYTLPDGTTRIVKPSCAGSPVSKNGELVAASTAYSFYIKMGRDLEKLMIYFEGGGACWDDTTCVVSPLSGQPTYTHSIRKDHDFLGGVFSDSNEKNPYMNYTKVVIPYCTADWHWGSQDTQYEIDTSLGSVSWTIHHRGVDNFLSSFDWLKKNQDIRLRRFRDVSLVGTEAGGYGVTLAFFYLADLVPSAQVNVIIEGSVGVMNEEFVKLAFYNSDNPNDNGGNWGVKNVLPKWGDFKGRFLPNTLDDPNSFLPKVMEKMRDYKSSSNLALVTSAQDSKQIEMYKLIRSISNETLPSDVDIKSEWYNHMHSITRKVKRISGTRIHVDSGSRDTVMSTKKFYRKGTSGVPLNEWTQSMIGWENIDVNLDL